MAASADKGPARGRAPEGPLWTPLQPHCLLGRTQLVLDKLPGSWNHVPWPEQGSCGWAAGRAAQDRRLVEVGDGVLGWRSPGDGAVLLAWPLGLWGWALGWPKCLAGARARVASIVLAGLGLTPDLSLTPEEPQACWADPPRASCPEPLSDLLPAGWGLQGPGLGASQALVLQL